MSLMHNIRNFAEIQLQGVIPWAKFSFPDETHTDIANVSIDGKAGLYRIVVSSSYAVPPLGKVVFKDHNSGHEIEGDNQDGTWHRISEYLKAAESPNSLSRLSADWPEVSKAFAETAQPMAKFTAPIIPLPVTELPIPPVALVYYIADPGVWYQNGPALVTRIHPDGSYNLTIFPDGSEPFYRERVGQRSDTLKNICWVEYPNPANKIADGDAGPDLVRMIADSRDEVAVLAGAVNDLNETISRLKASAFDQRKSA